MTFFLRSSPDREAALDQLLSSVTDNSSLDFHKWLTPQSFATRFGATDDQVAALTGWAAGQNLSLERTSPGRTSVTFAGTAAQFQRAFAVSLEQYQVAGSLHFASVQAPVLPDSLSPMIAAVAGLNDLPSPGALMVAGTEPRATLSDFATLTAAAQTIDDNVAPVISLTNCSTDVNTAVAYRALFRQANAQGITLLASSGCQGGAASAVLAEVTASAAPGDASVDPATETEPRPAWQSAPGMPAGEFRQAPDLTVSSVAALAGTVGRIVAETGTRQGNIDATLYALAPIPGLFTQPDAAAAGTWEPGTGLGLVDLAKLAQVYPRGTAGSNTSISSSTYAPVHGQTFTLTATVTASSGSAMPTGSVTFQSAQKGVLGTSSVTNGVATFSTNQLAGGAYGVSATYSGDGNFGPSTSGIATVTVTGEPSQISATVAAGAAVGGTVAVNVTVTAASGVGMPTGTVTVQPQGTGSTTTYTGVLSPSAPNVATATVTFPATQAGSVTLLVNCSGDASFTCFSPISVQATIGKASSTPGLTISPSPPVPGAAIALTATVPTLGSAPPTGTVQFLDGISVVGSGTIAAGIATYNIAALAAGKHVYTAVYGGDANYAPSTSPAVTVSGGTVGTTTSLVSSSYAVNYGQPFTLTAGVTPASTANNAAPTGIVTFTSAAQGVIGTAPLISGTATFTAGALPVGTYTLTANYAGDNNYSASASTSSVVVTVSIVTATLAATISPTANVPYGSTATVTATVTLPMSTATPSGTVTAQFQGVTGGTYTATLSPNPGNNSATANIIVNAPATGTYTIQVTCAGNTNFQCQTPVNLLITTIKGNTQTAITINPTAPQAGQQTTITATVANASNGTGTYAFSGSVGFYSNGKLVATSPVATNQATAQVMLAGGKLQNVNAIYSGDFNWNGSTSSAITVTPSILPAAIALTSNLYSALAGANIVLTATVSPTTPNAPLPSGTVSFFDTVGTTFVPLGSAAVVSTGPINSVATLATTGLAGGTHTVYAIYSGDANFATVTSANISVMLSDYNLVLVPTTATVNRGQTAQTTVIVNLLGGFNGTIGFGCTPPPNSEATCAFSPASLTNGGSTTMTITTTAPKSSADMHQAGLRAVAGISFATLLFLVLPRRRSLARVFLLIVAFGLAANIGCGSSSSSTPVTTTPPVTDPGTPLGTSAFVINTAGTDGVSTVRHNYQFQVTVQ